MIELKNIGITFNKNTPDENTALKNINLSINKSSVFGFSNENEWEQHFDWLQRKLEKFLQVFGPRVRALQ